MARAKVVSLPLHSSSLIKILFSQSKGQLRFREINSIHRMGWTEWVARVGLLQFGAVTAVLFSALAIFVLSTSSIDKFSISWYAGELVAVWAVCLVVGALWSVVLRFGLALERRRYAMSLSRALPKLAHLPSRRAVASRGSEKSHAVR